MLGFKKLKILQKFLLWLFLTVFSLKYDPITSSSGHFKKIHVYAKLVIIPFELKVTLIALTKKEGVKDAFVSF